MHTTVLRQLYRSTYTDWYLQIRTGGLCWCTFYCPHALDDGNQAFGLGRTRVINTVSDTVFYPSTHSQNFMKFHPSRFRSTLRQSRPNKASLTCQSVCTYVRAYVRPSTKRFFDFSEIWHVGRGRWLMHDGVHYDPIQGQGQGHEPFKVGNPAIIKRYILRHLQWELQNWPLILKLGHNS